VQVGAAVQQRDERAAAREPDGGLAARVASPKHGDTFGAAELRLGRPGGVEDAHALVFGERLNRQASVLRASREHDCQRGDLAVVLQSQHAASVSSFERMRAVGIANRAPNFRALPAERRAVDD
jgi:hypothetical protein